MQSAPEAGGLGKDKHSSLSIMHLSSKLNFSGQSSSVMHSFSLGWLQSLRITRFLGHILSLPHCRTWELLDLWEINWVLLPHQWLLSEQSWGTPDPLFCCLFLPIPPVISNQPVMNEVKSLPATRKIFTIPVKRWRLQEFSLSEQKACQKTTWFAAFYGVI